MDSINLANKLSLFSEHWQARVVGQFNGHDLIVAKAKDEFVWHQHDDTDHFFLVLKGRLSIQMRDGNVTLGPTKCSWSLRACHTALSLRRKCICCS